MSYSNAFHHMMDNVTFDELRIGQTAQMVRTLSNADILAFAAVSGDINPAHLDVAYAAASRFHGVIAHGLWGGALISALLGTRLPGPGTIYLHQYLDFIKPVRLGDTLTVTVTVLSKTEEGHRVTLDCVIHNQHSEVVLKGQARVIAPTDKMHREITSDPDVIVFDPAARLNALLAMVSEIPPLRCAVVHPVDAGALGGALEAAEHKLIVPVLIGPAARIAAASQEAGTSLDGVELVDVPHSHAGAERAAQMAVNGDVELLMKGSLHTDELLQAVLAVPALRTGRRMSHAFRFDVPLYPKPLFITDAALNINPGLCEKADIVRNVIDLAHLFGIEEPRVAILAAVETINPDMPATVDAAALCKMAQRGQITGALLDGPLAFDNAISIQAAQIKGLASPVAGQADILLVPDLEAGNMLAKQLEYLAGASGAGVVLGCRVPIALSSRADTAATRVASLALAVKLAFAARTDPVRQLQLQQQLGTAAKA